jgi:hypothetical protein
MNGPGAVTYLLELCRKMIVIFGSNKSLHFGVVSMKSRIIASLMLVTASMATQAALAQFSGSNQTMNNGALGNISGNSGGNNAIQASSANNRQFQNNNNLNSVNNLNGFSGLNSVHSLNNMNNPGAPFFANSGNSTSFMNSINSNSNTPSDADIANDVRRGLISPGLSANARNSSVTSLNGMVTLTGSVTSQTEKTRLEQNARSSIGVKSVINNLMIRPQ